MLKSRSSRLDHLLFADRPHADGLEALVMQAAERAPVAGIDEAGRGPWAGPVVAAAVILDPAHVPEGLDDSKKLSAHKREALYGALQEHAVIGVGIADVEEIDRNNILGATFHAMQRALAGLAQAPGAALIDGNKAPALPCPAHCIIGGDGCSPVIAAASIIAKVTRDRIMAELALTHPGYGWETNMGYGTKAHADGLARLGVTAHHRKSFKPVQALLGPSA